MPATGSDASAAAALAMAQYFDGERREMYAIVAGSLVCVGLALCLLLVARDGFAKGLMVVVVISAGLLSATAGSLLVRDAALRTELQLHFRSETAPQAVDGERKRLAVIIANYKYYRYAAFVLGFLALLAFVASQRGWVHGAAAGVLVLVLAQVVIDHYSKHRAQQYLEQLTKRASEEPVVLRG